MGRYREIRTATELEKHFPFIVEEAAPTIGFGQLLNLIEA